MLGSGIPAKFPIMFGADAGGAYIRPIPQASQIGIQDGAASLTDGFPPLNFIPRGAGGVPPFGEDVNGILFQLSAWAQWQSAGGPVVFDGAFATAIGGYPKGSTLQSTTVGQLWQSTVDNNLTDPDGLTPVGWASVSSQVAGGNYAADTGTAGAYVVALAPAIAKYTPGLVVRFIPGNTNGGASTLNVNGKGAKAIVFNDGTPMLGSEIAAAGLVEVVYQAALDKFVLVSFPAPPTGQKGGGVIRVPGTAAILQYGSYGPVTLSNNTGAPSPMWWGQATINFPITFPTAANIVLCTPTLTTDTTAATATAVINSASHFLITCADTATPRTSSGFWLAIGS